MSLILYNTKTRAKEVLAPITPGRGRDLLLRTHGLFGAASGPRPRGGGIRCPPSLAGGRGLRRAASGQRDRRRTPRRRCRPGRGQAAGAGQARKDRADGGCGEVLLELLRRAGPAECAATGHRPAGDRTYPRATRPDRGVDPARSRLRAGGQRLLRRLGLGAVRRALWTRPGRTT